VTGQSAAFLARAAEPGNVGATAVAATTAVVVGLVVATGHGLLAASFVAGLGGLVLALRSWRASLFGLLIYIPFSGVPIILSYPDTHLAVLLKDVFFIIPAYIGFFAWASTHRVRIVFPGAPMIPLLLLALLVLGQTLNPLLPNLLVGAIGVKVWLFYIPLYFLGYHLVRDRRDLSRLLAVMSVSAVLPLVVGIMEAFLIKGGHADIVYRWYGDAASAVSQGFAQFDYAGGGTLRRVSSTFSFVAQYYLFAASIVVVTYAWWRGVLADTKHSKLGRLLWLLAIAATFLSGARGAFLLIPVLVLLIVAFDHGTGVQLSGRLLAPIAALVASVAALGAATPAVIGATLKTGALEFESIFVEGFRQAIDTTWLGLGTGADTNATRYAYSDPELLESVAGTWQESWWVKVVLELGVPGLLLVCLLFTIIIWRALHDHRTLHDPRLRAISAAFIAFLIWNLIYGLKGQYLDLDPVNVYFWLLMGVLAKLPALDAPARSGEEGEPQ
jgi:hypothetical protein